MAEAKIEVKGLPEKGLSRIFNRIDIVKEIPHEVYDTFDTPQEDRAEFELKAVDPVTRDEIKQIVMSFSTIMQQLCEANGIEPSDLGGLEAPKYKKATPKATAKKKKEITEANKAIEREYAEKLHGVKSTLVEYKQAIEYLQCGADARKLIARGVVSISNYKENDGGELVETKKSKEQIVDVMHDSLCLWAFNRIQELSNLTAEEVMGL